MATEQIPDETFGQTVEVGVKINELVPAFSVEIATPRGTFILNGGLSERGDGALVVFIDTPGELETGNGVTGDMLRVNVNDAMVFGYTDEEMAEQR